jgi:hypothetical protein
MSAPEQDMGVWLMTQAQHLVVDPNYKTMLAMRRFCNETASPGWTALAIAGVALAQYAELVTKGTPSKVAAHQYFQELIDGLNAQREAAENE